MNRIESESDEDSADEVLALRKSVYAAAPDTDDDSIEEAAYSKSTRRSIHGFVPKMEPADSDDSSEESDAIAEEDEEEDSIGNVEDVDAPHRSGVTQSSDATVDLSHEDIGSMKAEQKSVVAESSDAPVDVSHLDESVEILEASSASIVDLTNASVGDGPSSPDVTPQIRLPLKELKTNRSMISNESFDNSIMDKMSSTLSSKEESSHEASGVTKVRVSPSTYEAEQQAIDALQRKVNSTMKVLEMAHQLPDRGFKLKETIKANMKEIENKQRLLATWEVDENLSIKKTIAKSFHSAQNSHMSIDESVEDMKPPVMHPNQLPKMPTSSQQLVPGVDVRDVQPKFFGKIGMQHFNEQKAATVDKLRKLQSEIDARPNEEELDTAPKYLKIELMKHQLHAVKFMLWRESSNPKGGLLADDMGLGKTLTTISLIMKSIQRAEEDGIESEEESDDESDEGWKARGRRDLKPGGEFESLAHVTSFDLRHFF